MKGNSTSHEHNTSVEDRCEYICAAETIDCESTCQTSSGWLDWHRNSVSKDKRRSSENITVGHLSAPRTSDLFNPLLHPSHVRSAWLEEVRGMLVPVMKGCAVTHCHHLVRDCTLRHICLSCWLKVEESYLLFIPTLMIIKEKLQNKEARGERSGLVSNSLRQTWVGLSCAVMVTT